MKRFGDGIHNKVLKEIFPKRINRSLAAEQICTHIKRTIHKGKLRKGQRLFQGKNRPRFRGKQRDCRNSIF